MKILFMGLMIFSSLLAEAKEQVMGYDVLGNFIHEVIVDNVQISLEQGQKPGQRYKLVLVGCGTGCASYGAVIDFKTKIVYALDKWVDALLYDTSEEMAFEFQPMQVNQQQLIFTDLGVITVKNNQLAEGRFLSTVVAKANQLADQATSDKYVPINVGCGTECYTLLGVLEPASNELIVLEQEEFIDAYAAEETPMAIKVEGKNFVYDGKSLKEFSFN